MLKKILILLLFTINLVNISFSQDFNQLLYKNTSLNPVDSNKLFINIDNINFIKNNEYFINYEGQTLLGFIIEPQLTYMPTKNTRIEAGVSLLKYSGVGEFTNVLPILSFQYKIDDHIDFILGTIYGTINHKLIEPLYQFDRFYQTHVDNGFQFLFNYKHWNTDFWVDWDSFIFPKSTFKEQFVWGTSNNLIITNPESALLIKIPIQTLMAHKGGQIDVAGADSFREPTHTLFNTATGLVLGYNFKTGFIRYIGLDGYFATFQNISTTLVSRYRTGNGVFSNFNISSKIFSLVLGYWDGYQFVAPRGEPLFESISPTDGTYYQRDKKLVTAKFSFSKVIYKGINLGARFEAYYDPQAQYTDYSYGVFINFNHDFFLKKF